LAARGLWYIGGRAYDLTPWIAKHPGGRDALIQVEGTDCTELFRTYHLKKVPLASLMARYEVAVDVTDAKHALMLKGSNFTFEPDGFYKTVQDRVREYFKTVGEKSNGTKWNQAFAILMFFLAIALIVPALVYGNIWAAMALALTRILAAIGPGHSMSHFCLFPRGRWNTLGFRLMSPFLISNPAIWSATHIQSHHVHTLTAHDLQDNYPVKRVQPLALFHPLHRIQHLYIWPTYMIALPLWALGDLVDGLRSLFFNGKYDRTSNFSFAQRVENTLVMALNLFITVALPFIFLDWKRALLIFAVAVMPASFFLVVQIAVNHEVPDTMSQIVPEKPIDWGMHQVLTSHNFAVGSFLAMHFSGGLNMQIEHHLFPGVHYSHYHAITPIVREACAQFNLPYNESSSLWEAMRKHYRLLKRNSDPLSTAPQNVVPIPAAE
jgi:fatty acid desaturase